MPDNAQPLVTLVIPAYNAMPYLEEAIESVLAQDYPKIELIVLDDGSTDNTAVFLQKYQGKFYFETHANRGQAATVNKGWEMAKGEIISYLSADDILTPNAVSTSVNYLLENPQCIMSYCDNVLINSFSQPIRNLITPEYDFIQLYLGGSTPVAVGSFFWRKTFLAVGGWNPDFKQIGDYEYHLRLSEVGELKRIPQILGYHRVHPESASYREISFERANEYVKLMNRILTSTKNVQVLALKNRILSQAYLVSGRTHWRSKRYKVAGHYLFKSIGLYPQSILQLKTYKIIANALLNKKMHKLVNFIKKYRKRFK